MTKDEALQLALDSMKEIIHWYAVRDRNDVFLNFVDQNPEIIGTPKEKKYMTKDEAVILLCEHFSEGMVRTIVDAIAKDEALEKKDEPVAWMNRHGACKTSLFMEVEAGAKEEYTIPLYTTPQQRKPLTRDEVEKLFWEWKDRSGYSIALFEFRNICNAIEAAHGIKE